MGKKDIDKLAAQLGPESLKETFFRAGCFLCAYELIKLEVVGKVHDFFWRGFDDEGRKLYDDPRYQRDVLSRNPKSRYQASCGWLIDMGALTAEQVTILEQIHMHRQQIAHEMPNLLLDPDIEVKTDLILAAADCVRALGVFWGRMTVDADPQWDGQDVADEDIQSIPYLLMDYLVSIAGLRQPNDEDSQ